MKWEINDSSVKLPIKSWCEKVEEQALQQARNLANHPVTMFHVALMPDCHVGYGMPIGGVIAVRDAVIPNAVGVDIGCGMVAVETSLEADAMGSMERRQRLIALLKSWIPAGEGRRHGSEQQWQGFERFVDTHPEAARWWPSKLDRQNLGTLGGGNHFIELQVSDSGMLWLMLHSGSRNLGQRVANYYHGEARSLNSRQGVELPDADLAFLPVESQQGQGYLRDMKFALEYAYENRQRMLTKVKQALGELVAGVEFGQEINIHHNYAAKESHFGRDLYVHRKGATSAKRGEIGIIPGSMGTNSFIVKGLGNPDSFMSCSHGAGRVMSRSEANRSLSEDACNRAMRGIAFSEWGRTRGRRGRGGGGADLSEAPQAYKDINEVMAAQRDLVEVMVTLSPLAVVKG